MIRECVHQGRAPGLGKTGCEDRRTPRPRWTRYRIVKVQSPNCAPVAQWTGEGLKLANFVLEEMMCLQRRVSGICVRY